MTVATRVPGGVICLISALAFYELTTQIPHEVHVALPRGAEEPRLDHPPITVNPTVFDISFTKDEDKKVQWLGFIKKAKITDAPGSFKDVATAVKVFLEPIAVSIVERQTFHGIWSAPGPWR